MQRPRFVNRVDELRTLNRWWESTHPNFALVWGRRRVGKTALIQRFAQDKRTVFHTGAGRPRADELRMLSRAMAATGLHDGSRDLSVSPFRDWDEVFEVVARIAADEPLLLVLDEFTELTATSPELPGILRAFWDRAHGRTGARILISGSAVRTLNAMIEEREPLFGRFDTIVHVHPFRPHEAALMLPGLAAEDRALVWGLLGGTPLYLSWWNQDQDIRSNVERLFTDPDARLLQEGRLLLTTEADATGVAGVVMRALGAGRTKYGEIQDAVGTQPARSLDALVELRLIERQLPVTESGRSKRARYAISDNFLRFWLKVLDPHLSAIERGLGPSITDTVMASLDDHMGPSWEEAFRAHLGLMATRGELRHPAVAIGPWWNANSSVEIDAVALTGRARTPYLAGEAKWTRTVDGARLTSNLVRAATALPADTQDLEYALCARSEVTDAPSKVLTVTAEDIFGL